MRYKRILLKLSGESLMGNKHYGIDPERIHDYVEDIKSVASKKIQIAVVIGGGNIFRGLKGVSDDIGRVSGDYMGMLATVINSLALQSALETAGLKTIMFSGIEINPVCELMSGSKAKTELENGKIVIIAGGTGNPFFTTDTAAALRALEINADVILKGTRVDGVYTSDPEKDPGATKYKSLSFDDAYKKGLEIMDLTAFTLCRENKMPIVVFDVNVKGNLLKVCAGEECGTLIHP
jgi:uridylate kinase